MDRDSKTAVIECPRCRNFCPKYINSLLQPIRCREPFDLISVDYLSLPMGKGGFKTVLLITDTFSNFTWAYKLKSAGTGKTTLTGLNDLCLHYWQPDTFMTDGGAHFNNSEVNEYCRLQGIEHITTPAYAPWTNGLIENTNKILLGRLKRLCAPDLEDDTVNDPDPKATPAHWTEHMDEAIRSMNDRILPALGFTPRELLWGLRETAEGRVRVMEMEATQDDTTHHFTFSDLLRSQGHTAALAEATHRKAQFDNKVHPVVFKTGDLVQVYDSKLDNSYETRAKLIPNWSPPQIVTDCLLNSYMLSKLDGMELNGTTHARRLQRYLPRRGGLLDQRHPTEPNEGWIQEWDEEEDDPITSIGGLFAHPDATRACVI